MTRHQDFQRIYDEFCYFLHDESKAEVEYYDWIKGYGIDESKPYNLCLESLQDWGEDVIKLVNEDTEAKYYEVIVGLPITSMNGNVYSERDLAACSALIKGRSPSYRHEDRYWFSDKNPNNRWGKLENVAAKYYDGATKAVLKVPRNAVCPDTGKPMTDMLDTKQIINVSLEGTNNGRFEYGEIPYTLLPKDVLPGIPLARIKPLEKIVSEAFIGTKLPGNKKMKITPTIKEESANTTVNTKTLGNPDFKGNAVGPTTQDSMIDDQTDNAKTVLGTPAASDNLNMHVSKAEAADTPMQCPTGTKFNPATGECEPTTEPETSTEKLTEEDTSQPRPEDIRSGPTKKPAPTYSTPTYGSLPGEEKPKVVLGTAPANSGVWTGTNPVGETLATLEAQRAQLNAEMKASGAEAKALRWQEEHVKLSNDYAQSLGTIAALKLQTAQAEERKENALRDMHNAQVERERYERLRNDVAGERDDSRINFEKLKHDYDVVNKKYNESMQTNLALSGKLTEANKDYLDVAKELELTKEALERTRIEAKKILKVKV